MIKSAKLLRVAVLGVALSSIFVIGSAAASIGAGTTTAPLKVREGAGTDTNTLVTANQGDNVVVLEDAGNGWYKVDYQGVQGFMSGQYLTIQAQADLKIGYGMVKTDGSTLNMRNGASTEADVVTILNDGDIVDIIGVDNGWFKVQRGEAVGYVSSDYMVTSKDNLTSRGADGAVAASSDLGSQIVAYAKKFVGTPYVYGANGPGSFDCSGFTSYVYAHFGYTLNRSASGQSSNGVKASSGSLQPGDLIIFAGTGGRRGISHVGIYIGDDQFIHCSTNGYKVRIDSLFGSSYYSGKYHSARRVI